ncbi:MXAN_6640 family putative metalloprotease [Nocardioides sp. T2.26MG-1]|uniref:MXAN_6640 family putative metalloprotease n=1 Tax=Nocardioides sp. T2.26MG-1 TaxID=3041166 RepID=UPI002477C110|nr:MXAN_6640 family putative metalloprotease [Nocardioides sp. T2.26MG-1]CAI9416286.1 hypothetical protein HIDPHFAB_02735 [Nocardioides sp. T2.26MG-1]
MHLRPALAVPAVLTTLAVLVAGGLSVATAADDHDSRSDHPAKVSASRSEARAVLAEAQAVLSGEHRGDATMALRDLWLHRGDLAGADRAAANRLLARPDLPQSACTADNCYHWTTSGADAVPATDADSDGTPDYVEAVIATVDGVHDRYVAAGYRAPKADGVAGGDAKTDIYLEDVFDEGLYGYCTSDMPNPPATGPFDAWAYCVLDNDYAGFPTNTPLENLQVTAAHEYFHAVQFGYDALEDSWLMEATATWAEDELYDDVDDNLQYLPESPLKRPAQPLDTFNEDGAQYGTWVFFRFLTEQLDAAEGGLPTLVRDIWRRADGAAGGRDEYSIQAVANTLGDYGYDLTTLYALFATANRAPARWYAEGAANHYPTAPPAGSFKLTSAKKDSGWKAATLKHLSSVTARFVPGTGLSATSWKLRLTLDLPDRATRPAAVVTVYRKAGAPLVSVVPLSSSGGATRKVGFGSKSVRYVEVTLANVGTRYTCWNGGAYSCNGSSRDDGRKVLVRATATR